MKTFDKTTILAVGIAVAICTSHTMADTEELASAQAMVAGWTDGTVTYTPEGENGIMVDFAAASAQGGVISATVLVDAGVDDSPFHGDYVADAINTIQFGVTGSGLQPSTAKVALRGATRRWMCDFDVLPTAGARLEVNLALTIAAGWEPTVRVSGATDAELSALLAQDLQSVMEVSILFMPVKPSGTIYPAQSYTIDTFVLVNDDGVSSAPADLSGLEKALIARFGYGYGSVDRLTAEMKSWDGDGDGMHDYTELWAENDEAFANSIFAAESIDVVEDGVHITWTCVAGESYTVLSVNSLDGTFQPVPGLTALTAAETGFMAGTDASSAPGGYYRIRKN